MRSFSSAVLLVCLHGGLQRQLHLAGALRDSAIPSLSETDSAFFMGHASVQKENLKGEEKPIQQCLCAEKECNKAADIVLNCPSGKRVGIVSAFWNRRKRDGCHPKEEQEDQKAGIHCEPNATAEVVELCQGQEGASCTIQKGFTGCKENPFTWMRVRWHCQGEEAVVGEELAMENGNGGDLPTMPTMPTHAPTPAPAPWEFQTKPKPLDKTDKEVKDWKEEPDRRLSASNLKVEHCSGLEVGSWPKVGQTGCELERGVNTLSPSPHFNEDAVCRCHFWTPNSLPHLGSDCDKIFPDADTVYKISDKPSKRGKGKKGKGGKKETQEEGTIAIFGKEGCHCHSDPEQPGWTLCDLAVKEV